MEKYDLCCMMDSKVGVYRTALILYPGASSYQTLSNLEINKSKLGLNSFLVNLSSKPF